MSAALEVLLGQYQGERAIGCHLALLQLRRRVEHDLVTTSIICAEIYEHNHWSKVRRADNRPYESAEAYFTEVLGVTSFRSAAKRIAIGRLIQALTEGEREPVAQALADVGLAKATVLLPALEGADAVERERWFGEARKLPIADLQAAVSKGVGAKSRGVTPRSERFLRFLIEAMPDIETREMVSDVFQRASRLAESDNPIRIFILMVKVFEADLAAQGG